MRALYLFFLILSVHLFGDYPNFTDNPLLTKKMKTLIEPYLLPLDHPAKELLDLVFPTQDVIENEETLINSGFITKIQHGSSMVVAKHPLVPGYIFKIYRNSRPIGRDNMEGFECLALRCKNAKKTRSVIAKHNIIHFKAPEKWLYPLPITSKNLKKHLQPIVLIATDMELEPRETTKLAWKNADKEALNELYIIFKEGYGSTYLINNIPFSKHGVFAIVDIEKPKRKLNIKRVEKYFSPDNKAYWKKLIN